MNDWKGTYPYRCGPSIMLGLSVIACGARVGAEEGNNDPKEYHDTWNSLATHPVPQWFDDAKFGIFIHWGGCSVIGHLRSGRGYAEHAPKFIYRRPGYYYPYLKERFGAAPPEFG